MKRQTLTLLALVLVFLLAACGGESESEGPSSVAIEVSQNDIYFGDTPNNADDPPTWTVPTGAQVNIQLTNTGALEHNFALVKIGEEIPVPYVDAEHGDIILLETGVVAPGETINDIFVAPAPGEYTVICTVAGHYPGMQAKLIVTDG